MSTASIQTAPVDYCVKRSKAAEEREPGTVSEQLREACQKAIESKEWTRYRLAQESGVAYPVLTKFLFGNADIHSSTIDKLCQTLGHVLCPAHRCKDK